MPRKKEVFEAMRENTRRKIELGAVSLFARKGLSVTVDDIARAAGVSKGMLYNHYPSKEALIIELARQASEVSSQSIRMLALSEGTAVQKIRQVTAAMCEMLEGNRTGSETFMFMIQVGLSDFQIPAEYRYSEKRPDPSDSLAQIVAAGQAEGSTVNGDPVQLALTYWAVVQGMCCYASASMPLMPDQTMLNRILLKEDYL